MNGASQRSQIAALNSETKKATKMKNLKVETQYIGAVTNNPNGITIEIPSEGWKANIICQHPESQQDLELAEMTIYLPGEKKWVGNIQDFAAIFSIAGNVLKEFTVATEYVSYEESIEELNCLLSHLK